MSGKNNTAPATVNRPLRIVTAVTTLVMIGFNILANALPLFGRNTGEVSALYPSAVTPAGYAFAIWGVIYLGMLVYAVAQFRPPLAEDPLPDRLAWPLIAANVANVLWLTLWHALAIPWSVVVMLALLVSLTVAYRIAHSDRQATPLGARRWSVQVPISIYLGWISVATIANIAGALGAADWSRWGIAEGWWGAIVLVVAAGIALAGLAREGSVAFAIVFVWSFIAVAIATSESVVRFAAIGLAVVVALGVAATTFFGSTAHAQQQRSRAATR